MRHRSVIVIAVSLAALLACAVAVVLYDHSRRDTIAQGITVAGVDVGGLSAAEARAKLERDYVPGLRAPVVVNHDRKQFRLGARESRVAANVGAAVDDALARGREGNVLTRTWRNLTGGNVDADVSPHTTFSSAAAVRLLDKVRKSIDRKPVEAEVQYAASGISVSPSQAGLAVRAGELHRQIRRAIVDPRADHTISARTRKVEPATTTDELADKFATILVVDRGGFRLRLYKRLELAKTYPIAVGKVGQETPAGLYDITNKAVDPAWTKPHSDWVPEDERGEVVPGGVPENPLKARWLGVYDGVGVHGTADRSSIGTNASQGCIRMLVEDVKALYDEVPVGAPIYIA